jgi:hypothetical protein
MKLYHKDGAGCSWGGETFVPDADGAIDVPVEAVADLASHGFSGVAPEKPEPADPVVSGNPARWTKDVLAAEAERLGIDPTLERKQLLKLVAEARKAEADVAAAEAEKE